MKLEIYKKKDVETEKKKPVRIALFDDNGDVDVAVVDEDGEIITYLVSICDDGTMLRYTNVEPGLGFQLTDTGMVELDE